MAWHNATARGVRGALAASAPRGVAAQVGRTALAATRRGSGARGGRPSRLVCASPSMFVLIAIKDGPGRSLIAIKDGPRSQLDRDQGRAPVAAVTRRPPRRDPACTRDRPKGGEKMAALAPRPR